MRVLDLFCGLKGWSRPFEERGHEVTTVDIDPRFDATYTEDLLESERFLKWSRGQFDVVLASPPCESFSVASIGTHWTGGKRAYEPKTEQAKTGMALVQRTLDIITWLEPKVAIIENPRDVLRNLGIIPVDPVTVWYCHYGEGRAKPTDLWGLPFPKTWFPRPECHNRRPGHTDECCCYDHEAAPRGAKTGTQGLPNYARRSEIPHGLAYQVMCFCEADLRL